MDWIPALPNGKQLHDLPAEGDDPSELAVANAQAAHLRDLVASLPAREREVIQLRYGLQEPESNLREIGSRLGMSAATVWRLEQSGLDHLRDAFRLARAASGAAADTSAQAPLKTAA